ncbi:hypothetical protein ACP70R_030454 [Stipagrostis hirtigluma subsp. patula]
MKQAAARARPDRRAGDEVGRGATSWIPAALGLAGLATCSAAITCLAVSSKPSPPVLKGNDACYYFLTLSGLFYAGVAELGAAVWVLTDPRGGHIAAEKKLLCASLVPLAAAAALSATAVLG